MVNVTTGSDSKCKCYSGYGYSSADAIRCCKKGVTQIKGKQSKKDNTKERKED